VAAILDLPVDAQLANSMQQCGRVLRNPVERIRFGRMRCGSPANDAFMMKRRAPSRLAR
jgi:hypothetical protein